MREAQTELVTVRVLRKEGIGSYKLQPGTTVQLPDHLVDQLLDRTPACIEVIGQRGLAGRQPMKPLLHNAVPLPPAKDAPKRGLFTFTKLPERGEA